MRISAATLLFATTVFVFSQDTNTVLSPQAKAKLRESRFAIGLPLPTEGEVKWPIQVVSVYETQIVTTVTKRKMLRVRAFDEGHPITNYITLTNAPVVISAVTNGPTL